MPKKSLKTQKKEPSQLVTAESSSDKELFDKHNFSTKKANNQDFVFESDKYKGRHFWYIVYPSEDWVRKHVPNATYDGSSGWGTAPDDWIEQLQNTGLAFNVSPLHYMDVNPDNTPKKIHWHVIVSWSNTTTYASAKSLCEMLHSPIPQILKSTKGAYRYHKHLDNPEKYQYEDDQWSKSYNGWSVNIDSTDICRIKREIYAMIIEEDIREYAELLIICSAKGSEYFDVASNNTFYCDRVCASYRNNPETVLKRYYNQIADGDTKEAIGQRIQLLMSEHKRKRIRKV